MERTGVIVGAIANGRGSAPLQSRRVKILAISGSIRADSTNRRLLRAAAAVAPEGVQVTLFEGLAALPHFNPDLDVEGAIAPEAVASWREAVGAADALLISTPEYAHGVPGTLKNALDWLVSSPEVIGKPIAVLNASARSHHADASLKETLRTMSARIIDEASIVIALDGRRLTTEQMLEDPSIAEAWRAALAGVGNDERPPAAGATGPGPR